MTYYSLSMDITHDNSQLGNCPPPRSWRLPLLLVLLPVLTQISAACFPTAVERFYSQGAYPFVARCLILATGGVPFSIAEAALLVLLVKFAIASVIYIRYFLLSLKCWRRNL